MIPLLGPNVPRHFNQSNQSVPKKESLVVHHLYHYLIGSSYLPRYLGTGTGTGTSTSTVHPYRYNGTSVQVPTHPPRVPLPHHHIVKKSDKSENKKGREYEVGSLALALPLPPLCIRRIIYVYVYVYI